MLIFWNAFRSLIAKLNQAKRKKIPFPVDPLKELQDLALRIILHMIKKRFWNVFVFLTETCTPLDGVNQTSSRSLKTIFQKNRPEITEVKENLLFRHVSSLITSHY